MTSAVVLGAGGALGAAWMVGVLSALADTDDFDPREADLLVGTSAGSVVAALLGCGLSVDELVGRLDTAHSPEVRGTGPVNAFDVHESMSGIPRPAMRPGNLWLAARAAARVRQRPLMTLAAGLAPQGRGDLAPLAELIASANATGRWPKAPALRLVTMDFDSGRRVVWGGEASAPSLAVAVTASCAAPGYFPPVLVGERRYVDGGAVSMTNADLLAEARPERVTVLAPMAGDPRRPIGSPLAIGFRGLRRHVGRQLATEVRALRRAGAQVRVITPTAADLDAMGIDVMNPARRQEVLRCARDSGLRRIERDRPSADELRRAVS